MRKIYSKREIDYTRSWLRYQHLAEIDHCRAACVNLMNVPSIATVWWFKSKREQCKCLGKWRNRPNMGSVGMIRRRTFSPPYMRAPCRTGYLISRFDQKCMSLNYSAVNEPQLIRRECASWSHSLARLFDLCSRNCIQYTPFLKLLNSCLTFWLWKRVVISHNKGTK